MYVVSLIKDGHLIKTICKTNDQQALDKAREWVTLLVDSEGYVAIDKQVKSQQENVRYMEITFDRNKEKIEIVMQEQPSKFQNVPKLNPALKMYASAFAELALRSVLDYMQNQRTGKK